jgi:S-adenosylmethionine synthetase
MKTNFMFTSESVTEGHPDKLCDMISDSIIDHFLQQDPYSKIIAESAVSKGVVFVAARFASQAKVDIPEVARQVIHQVGYEEGEFSAKDCTVLTSITELPESGYRRVDETQLSEDELEKLVAKNQVTVFGFACNQTRAKMPLPIWLAHRLARGITAARLEKRLDYLAPDGMTQVGVEFVDYKPSRIHSITVIASQKQADNPSLPRLRDGIITEVVNQVFAREDIKPDEHTRLFVNPDGPLIGGGPAIHSGMTGRKNAVDTYGGYSRHSSSALSGKDPMRIDRVGAYAARYAAKNVVAAGLADECEIQLSYSIGLARPVSIQVETFGTGTLSDDEIAQRIEANFDFRLGGIIRQFNLRHMSSALKGGFYRKLAAYGQVGRMDMGLPWEKTDHASLLK